MSPAASPPEALGDALRRRLFDVTGLRTVVTGAASGLGYAMAEAMALSGAHVILVDRNAEGLRAAQDRLAQQGGSVEAEVVDVADQAAVEALFERLRERHGGVEVVFANAGIGARPNILHPDGGLDRLALDTWHRVMDINLHGAFYTMRGAAALMKPKRRGAIVVTASTAGLRPEPKVSYAYVTAKAALVNLVRQAALELAPWGIRVNAIAPGPFHTNIGGPGPRPPEDEAAWIRTIPLGRFGEPPEIQGLALFLASPASSFVTGAVYPIDGGASALTQVTADSLGPG
ncbi:MAG: SDR family oxidoreductase [Firmicutes bacterium]|nr:SDR family oxidoreductase [Alicyclobacillaceae bacterium]MCL6497361.1 SDR family oxidoreductase [Bacillota bacterium]